MLWSCNLRFLVCGLQNTVQNDLFLLVAQHARSTLRAWTTPQSQVFAMGPTLTRLFAAHLSSTLRALTQTTSMMIKPTVQPTCSRTSIWLGIIQQRYFQASVKVMQLAFPALWPRVQPLPFLPVPSLIHHGNIHSSWRIYSVLWQLFFHGSQGAGCFIFQRCLLGQQIFALSVWWKLANLIRVDHVQRELLHSN